MSVLKDYMTVTFMPSAQTVLAVITVHVLLAILEMEFSAVCNYFVLTKVCLVKIFNRL